jgi:hypothetical protein
MAKLSTAQERIVRGAAGMELLIRPDSRRGLTPEHMDQVEAFCRAVVGM